MTLVIPDASVAIKWVIAEEHSDKADELFGDSYQLLAPELIMVECGNILWKQVRFSGLTQEQAEGALRLLKSFAIDLVPVTPLLARALELGILFKRTVYDSVYLALAEQEQAAVVTADRRLYNALAGTPVEPLLTWIEDVAA